MKTIAYGVAWQFNRSTARDDLLSVAMIKLIKRNRRKGCPASLSELLRLFRTITKRTAIDDLHRKKAMQNELSLLSYEDTDTLEDARWVSAGPTQTEVLEASERRNQRCRLLREAIANLTQVRREAFVLVHLLLADHVAAAAQLGISVELLRSRLWHAREDLRQAMEARASEWAPLLDNQDFLESLEELRVMYRPEDDDPTEPPSRRRAVGSVPSSESAEAADAGGPGTGAASGTRDAYLDALFGTKPASPVSSRIAQAAQADLAALQSDLSWIGAMLEGRDASRSIGQTSDYYHWALPPRAGVVGSAPAPAQVGPREETGVHTGGFNGSAMGTTRPREHLDYPLRRGRSTQKRVHES